jgi:two-component system sensor histidine kinase PilS (NtrC family)
MNAVAEGVSWFGPFLHEHETSDKPDEFERLWRGFMTARATLGLVLLLLQGSIFFLNDVKNAWPVLICAVYWAAALSVRLLSSPQQLGSSFDGQWLRTVGVDLIAFFVLQLMPSNNINYAPLFALPVLMASVLGSMRTAMATAAGVTLLLLAYAGWQWSDGVAAPSSIFLQAALTGAGCFAISFIAGQLATRLASVELKVQRSQLAVTVQRQVNELVIASLTDGVLVVDAQHWVRLANPAAHLLLDLPLAMPLDLTEHPDWQGLVSLVRASFQGQCAQNKDISIRHEGQGIRRLRVRTQLTPALEHSAQGLCVVFIQDQREIQARMRTEKLASMGRMSAAVAHEIRNPLAAIVQANALLAEDLNQPIQKQLTDMVQQNAQRLEKIVHDILHVAQSSAGDEQASAGLIDLTPALRRICRDWQSQHVQAPAVMLVLPDTTPLLIWFEQDHLRRILVNLLDNALRYASAHGEAIQVRADVPLQEPMQAVCLRVWSDGGPLEPSVEQHLFEPFFSSESRSSGLGLYICRELCQSHGANIAYDRATRLMQGVATDGNEFSVSFKLEPMVGQVQS